MNEKSRLRRFGYGLAATVVLVVIAGYLFGSLGVTAGLAVGLAGTLLAGGGLGKR
ncbi:hypothetical protein [Roseomonas sp. AR75]|jgi:hypothetical protein|uniref:hypothetical protein n=1 Tax=Roseomonas sp. AR75 TaxID=2562311 RepID=UPI00148588AC|nr:hypothetical protein [Roseomonas sp. AR75]